MKITATLFLALALTGAAPESIYHNGWIDFNKNGQKDIYEDPAQSVDARVEDLLRQMTVEEKTCQLVTLYGCGRVLKDPQPTETWADEVWKDGIANIDEMLNGYGKAYPKYVDMIYPFSNHVEALHNVQRWFVENTRLGIPAEFSNEGIHGLNHTKATPLPAPIAIGSTWDRSLVRQAGDIAGHEAQLTGYHSVYAPILDVARDQRWGRTLECYGEDPYLVGELGSQMAQGIQQWEGVSAGIKHYVAYSVPKGGRDADCRTDPHITPRELHEIFLYPFRKVFAEAHPLIVMSSYNDWNGEPVSASHWFLTELLRDTYGFDGYVVSDSDAVEFVYTKHQVAPTYEDAIRQCLEAGLNVRTNFSQPGKFLEPLRNLIATGQLSQQTLDQRVREVLSVKFRLGLFDNPYTGDAALADKLAGADKNEEFVMKMGAESMVLLKNDGILPLDGKKVQRVLVTGPLADAANYMTSRYGPNGLSATTVLAGIREYLDGKGASVDYAKGCDIVDEGWPDSELAPGPLTDKERSMIEEAVTAAQKADVIIAVMGEDEKRTGESKSRSSLELPGRQRQLLQALHATGKPVVLVLVNGQPLTVNWENDNLPAILETWFQNCKGGTVIAKALFGDINPSGKLTVTFPRSVGQIEYNFPFKKGSHGGQVRSGGFNGNGVTRVVGELYPFGYGLSYTSFEYSDLKISQDGCTFGVDACITNTGKCAGDEIVQLYIRDKVSSVVTYDSVLRGFERVPLAPGESRAVHFTVKPEDLQILDKNMNWTVEPGEFEIMLGASSRDIRLKETVNVKLEDTVVPAVAATLRKQVLSDAQKALGESPVTVTAASCPRSQGGLHDFYSEGDYWWPDPKNPDGPYIRRDGMTNPDNFTAHREYMIRFSRIVGSLASAYILTGEDRYVKAIDTHVKAWFSDSATRMNPNLEYAQAIKGVTKGRGVGIIDTIHLIEVAQTIDRLSDVMDPKAVSAAKKWFRKYLEWMTESPNGLDEKKAKNNHATCWALQAAVFSRLVDDGKTLALCEDMYKNNFLPTQMAPDGSFPKEIARTKPYGYSLFNLDQMAALAFVLSDGTDDVWNYSTADGKNISSGVSYMLPFVKDKKTWPCPADVMFYEYWPVAHPFLLFSAVKDGKAGSLDLWRKLDHFPENAEVLRNLPIRNPLIWL